MGFSTFFTWAAILLFPAVTLIAACDDSTTANNDAKRCEDHCEKASVCILEEIGIAPSYEECLKDCKELKTSYVSDCTLDECKNKISCETWWPCYSCCEDINPNLCED